MSSTESRITTHRGAETPRKKIQEGLGFSVPRCVVGIIVAHLGICVPLAAQQASSGDAARGKTIVEGKGGCQSCHRISAIGSRIAPDLTTIGSALSAEAMTKTLTDPNGALRPEVRSIRAVTKDGKVVVGTRLNEDRYTVQFIDEQEHLRSLTKSELKEFTILTTARMPSFSGKLTSQEIADVVSYLRSLK